MLAARPIDHLANVKLGAAPLVQRAKPNRQVGTQRPQPLDVGEQFPADLFPVRFREAGNLGERGFEDFRHRGSI
jgi:hypothetical protein